MGMIHKKSRTTGKRPGVQGKKVAPNSGTELLALGLGVVLSLPIRFHRPKVGETYVVAPVHFS